MDIPTQLVSQGLDKALRVLEQLSSPLVAVGTGVTLAVKAIRLDVPIDLPAESALCGAGSGGAAQQRQLDGSRVPGLAEQVRSGSFRLRVVPLL